MLDIGVNHRRQLFRIIAFKQVTVFVAFALELHVVNAVATLESLAKLKSFKVLTPQRKCGLHGEG